MTFLPEILPKQTVDVPSSSTLFSCDVSVDPNSQLSNEWKDKFRTLHKKFDKGFEPKIGCYNDASGKIGACVNIGSAVPPTHKLHASSYSHSNLQMLQDKFDELEWEGVFAHPEDVGVLSNMLVLHFWFGSRVEDIVLLQHLLLLVNIIKHCLQLC